MITYVESSEVTSIDLLKYWGFRDKLDTAKLQDFEVSNTDQRSTCIL